MALVQESSNHAFQGLRRCKGRKSLSNDTTSIHQRLGEVPFDALASHEARRFLLQLLVNGVSVDSIDFNLLMDREVDLVL